MNVSIRALRSAAPEIVLEPSGRCQPVQIAFEFGRKIEMSKSVVNWAVVGTGGISHSVVPDFRQCDGAHVSLVHSRDPEKATAFARKYGIPRATANYFEVVEDPTVDAVYIATPIATHHQLVMAALTAGKHVLVEKPMAMTASEVDELFDAAQAHGVFLMEGMWMKFNPAFRRLHDEIRKGTIGEPRNIRAAFAFPFPEDGGSRWDIDRSGSTLLDQGIYPVTLAYSVFGLPTTIRAEGSVRADGVDLSQHFTMEFDDGRFAQCVSGMTEFSDSSAAVGGKHGWIALPAPFWSTTNLEIHAGQSYESIFEPPRTSLPKEGNGYVPMLREVNEAILSGATQHPVHTRRDTVDVFTVLDRIRSELTVTNVR